MNLDNIKEPASEFRRIVTELREDQTGPDIGWTRAPRFYQIMRDVWRRDDEGELTFWDVDDGPYDRHWVDEHYNLGTDINALDDDELVELVERETDLFVCRMSRHREPDEDLVFLTRKAADRELQYRPRRGENACSYSNYVWHSPDLENLIVLLCSLDLDRSVLRFKGETNPGNDAGERAPITVTDEMVERAMDVLCPCTCHRVLSYCECGEIENLREALEAALGGEQE